MHLREAYKKHAHTYNLRCKQRLFTKGHTVLVRNFTQSSAVQKYNAKLAPKFIKAIIGNKRGNVAYEIYDTKNRSLGIYHIKDIINL